MGQKYSCKESLLMSTLATISIDTDSMDLTNNNLIAVTAAGIIEGTYISDAIAETLKNDPTYIVFNGIRTLAAEKSDGSSASILLKDVTLSNQGSRHVFNYLHLFIEDIIALSFGKTRN